MSIIARIKDHFWNKKHGKNHKIKTSLDRLDLFAMLGGVTPDSHNRPLFERLRLGHWDKEKEEWKWDFWSPSFGTCPQPSYIDKYQNELLWSLYNLIKSQRLQEDTTIEDIDIEKFTIKNGQPRTIHHRETRQDADRENKVYDRTEVCDKG